MSSLFVHLPYVLYSLKQNGVILVPTETVYGLICYAESSIAMEKMYQIKHRPTSKLFTLFIDSTETFFKMNPAIPEKAKILAEKFFPGPLTLVVPDSNKDTYTGYRIPNHDFLLELLREFHLPLASTSANLSGKPSPHSVNEALASLAFSPDYVVDGGNIPCDSQASTVVQIMRDNSYRILRKGAIDIDTFFYSLNQ